jgi:hypothetical protein
VLFLRGRLEVAQLLEPKTNVTIRCGFNTREVAAGKNGDLERTDHTELLQVGPSSPSADPRTRHFDSHYLVTGAVVDTGPSIIT